MTVPVFVDTNVLVYRHDSSEPAKQPRAADWLSLLWRQRSGHLSYQVLQELYVTLTHKLKPGMDAGQAQQLIRDLTSWRALPIDLAVMERAWVQYERHSLSWWDALIIAAAQICDCQVLLTEDLNHGQLFGQLRVVNPFESPEQAPAEILETFD